ncbi:hypothetical protein [Nostoc sp.]|uniref:hypothetical protein n=1 Tax=Nostoc sp. TaxID=1180 RepID=UPI002FF38F67
MTTITNRQVALLRLAQLGFTGNVDDMLGVDIFLGVTAMSRHEQTGLIHWTSVWYSLPSLDEYPGWYYWEVANITATFLRLDYVYEIGQREWG